MRVGAATRVLARFALERDAVVVAFCGVAAGATLSLEITSTGAGALASGTLIAGVTAGSLLVG